MTDPARLTFTAQQVRRMVGDITDLLAELDRLDAELARMRAGAHDALHKALDALGPVREETP